MTHGQACEPDECRPFVRRISSVADRDEEESTGHRRGPGTLAPTNGKGACLDVDNMPLVSAAAVSRRLQGVSERQTYICPIACAKNAVGARAR